METLVTTLFPICGSYALIAIHLRLHMATMVDEQDNRQELEDTKLQSNNGAIYGNRTRVVSLARKCNTIIPISHIVFSYILIIGWKAILNLSIWRERRGSNPQSQFGRLKCYHYTTFPWFGYLCYSYRSNFILL